VTYTRILTVAEAAVIFGLSLASYRLGKSDADRWYNARPVLSVAPQVPSLQVPHDVEATETLIYGLHAGDEIVFDIRRNHNSCDGRNCDYTWPINMLNAPAILRTPGSHTVATFQYCGETGVGNVCPARRWENTDVSP
jgi:hypothetical protein